MTDVERGATAPDGRRLLYAVERHEETSVLRAFAPDGQEIWAQNLAGRVDQLSGDPLGGAVVLLRTSGSELPEVRELLTFTPDGRGTVVTNADSPGFAIHPDGPLYVVVGQQLKGIDIGLGQGRTVALPTGTWGDTVAGVPTVLADGSVTLPLTVSGGVHSPGESLDLLWLRPSGTVDVFPVDGDPTGFFQSFSVRPYKAIPNGLGGVLVAYDSHYYFAFPYDEARLRLVNADGSFGGLSAWGGTSQIGSWMSSGRLVLGEDRVRATSYRYNSQGSFVRVSDISLDGYGMTNFYVPGTQLPRFTAVEGGQFFESYADGSTWGSHPDHESVLLANAIYVGDGNFLGSAEGTIALRTGGTTDVADTEWPESGGNEQSGNTTGDPEFVITINVFIPEEFASMPFPGQEPDSSRVYGGDDRGFSRTGSSRIHQVVRVSRALRFPGTSSTQIGMTVEYDAESSIGLNGRLRPEAKSDTTLNDSHLKTRTATAAADGVRLRQERLGNQVNLVLSGAVPNPLLPSPDIDYEIRFSIDFTNPQNPAYSVEGEHDGFPNYEVYVNEQRIHHYEHGNATPLSLFPPAEKSLPLIQRTLRQ